MEKLPTSIYKPISNLQNFLEACDISNIDMRLLIEKQNWYNLIKNKNDLLQFLNAFNQHEIAKSFYDELLNFLFENTYFIQTVFRDYSVEFTAVKLVRFLTQQASELALDVNIKQFRIFIMNNLLKKYPEENFSSNFLSTIRNINDLDELILEFPEYDKQIIQTIFDDSILYLQIFSDFQDYIDFIQKYSSFKAFIIDEYIDYIQGIAWIEAGFINADNLKTLFEIFDEDQKLKFIYALLSNKKVFNQISYSVESIIQSLNLSVTITGKKYSVSGANLLIDYQYLHGSYPSYILARALFHNEKLHKPFKTQDVKIHLLSELNKLFERESFDKVEIEKCLDIITTFYRNNPNWQDNKNLVNVLKSLLMRLSFHPDIAGLKQLLLFNAIAKKEQKPNLPVDLHEKLLQAEDNEIKQQDLEKQQTILKDVKYAFKNHSFEQGLQLVTSIPINTASAGDGHTALHYACMYGDSHTVSKLIQMGGDVTALTQVRKYYDDETSLEDDVEKSWEEETKENALHVAARFKNIVAIAAICQNTSLDKLQQAINKVDDQDRTPIIIALRKNDYQTVKFLLQKGASNKGYYHGKNPMQLVEKYLNRDPQNKDLQDIYSEMKKSFDFDSNRNKLKKTTPSVQMFQSVNQLPQQDNNQQILMNNETISKNSPKK